MAKLKYSPTDGTQHELWKPASDWRPPVGPLPRLRDVVVAIDTETRDDGLAQDRGPGWVYDMAHLCGVSVAWEDSSLYVPVRHPGTECRDLREVLDWVEDILRNCTVCFFNMAYDMSILQHEGVMVWPEKAHDAYIMSVMLDENQQSYSLDECAARAGVPAKDTRLLDDAARAHGVDPRSGLWQLPARYVGPYAEQDAVSTLQLAAHLLPQIDEQRMRTAYQTEIDLVPCLHDMRRRGIRVSSDSAERAQTHVRGERQSRLDEIGRLTGRKVFMPELTSPEAVGRIFEAVGVECPKTPKTKLPSVKKDWLATLDHPMGELVREARQFHDLAEKFIGGYILEHAHRGRIHAVIHQLRDDDGGTRTQRLSYASPPLQQIPARPTSEAQAVLVAMVRKIFEPEIGEVWAAPDYSSQEPRIMVHLANLAKIHGAAEIAQIYNDDPNTDYHTMVAKIIGLPRKKAKDLNQGLAYGMGLKKLTRLLKVTESEAQEMLKLYETKLPYIGGLTNHCSNLAASRGWIRLLDGARCHFDQWSPRGDRDAIAVWTLEAAKRRWPGRALERAYTYRAANRAAQGGAARQMKRAMVACHKAGLKIMLQLHDELGVSVSTKEEAILAGDLMIHTTKLTVPVKVDVELGKTWGDAHHSVEEIFG